MHLKLGHPAPLELMIWTIAERFGWTLEYIDTLSMAKIQELIQIDDARARASARGKKVA